MISLVAARAKAYSVVCPEWYSTRVSSRWRHEGQSTGAELSPRPCSGVAC